MGVLTLANFRTELKYYLEGRTITDARLDRWLNQAYRMVSFPTLHKHWELEATIEVPLVADTFEYTLATSASYITRELLGVRSARYVDTTTDSYTTRRTQLGARSIGWFNRQTHQATSGGPVNYSIYRKNLVVTPGPNSSIAGNLVVLEVWEQPALLTAGSGTPSDPSNPTVLLDWWDEAILLGAKWMAEVALGFGEQAEISRQAFTGYIQITPFRENTGIDDEESFFPDMESGEPLQARN